MQNWTQTLLSRFASSPILVSLISSFNAAMDQTANINAFLQYIWDVRTAVGYGLNVWGKIVNVSRTIPSTLPTIPPITLGDADYQTLILVKAAANIGNATIPTLNKLLRLIFAGSGQVFVQDNLNMTLTYVFLFQPTIEQLAIVKNSGALPRPAGVLVDYVFATVIGPLNTAPLNTIPLNYLSVTQV
jgi:Protein of unknown function (DUF2612)